MTLSDVKGISIPEGAVKKIVSSNGRKRLWSKLPIEYRELEYIESSGAQYIDTGVLASDYPDGINYTFDGVVKSFTSSNSAAYLFGALANNQRSGEIRFSNGDYALSIMIGGNNDAIKYTTSFAYDQRIYLESSLTPKNPTSLQISIEGANISIIDKFENATASDMPGANIYLLTLNGTGLTTCLSAKIYSFTMKSVSSGKYIRDFIPCYRKSDNKPGLYDLITDTFFTNNGTGEFVQGEGAIKIPSEYEQVEYLRTINTTSYINTGYLFKGKGKFRIKCKTTNEACNYFCGTTDNERLLRLCFQNYNDVLEFYGKVNSYGVFTDIEYNKIFDFLCSFDSDLLIVTDIINQKKVGHATPVTGSVKAIDYPFYVLGQNYGNSIRSSENMYVYYFALWDENDRLFCEYIPCYRKSDDKPGMYDTVTGNFFTNNGTGEFDRGKANNEGGIEGDLPDDFWG